MKREIRFYTRNNLIRSFKYMLKDLNPRSQLYNDKARALAKVWSGCGRKLGENTVGQNWGYTKQETSQALEAVERTLRNLNKSRLKKGINRVISSVPYPLEKSRSNYVGESISPRKLKLINMRHSKKFSVTMTEEELSLFSEFLEQKEFNSKAQKARRRKWDIEQGLGSDKTSSFAPTSLTDRTTIGLEKKLQGEAIS